MDTNRGKQKVSSEDILDAGAVSLFRDKLAERNLLPASQDNYHTMLRFLKATRSPHDKRYNYDSAILKWKEVINWRRRNQVDTIIQDFVYKEHQDVQLYYPQGFHGVDKAGRPIYIEFADRIDSAKLMEVTTEDRFIKSYVQECEKMVVEKFPACSKIANKHIDSSVLIFVQPGPNNRNKGSEAVAYANRLANRLTKTLVDYYPQTYHQVFYINAGKWFRLSNIVYEWLRDPWKRPVRTYALGQDFRTKLLEFIDEECDVYFLMSVTSFERDFDVYAQIILVIFHECSQLPTLLGGSCSCPGKEGGCLRFEKGPWEVPQSTNEKLPSDSGPALSPETACHKCTELEYNVNLLSSKVDKLQTTVNLLSSAQDRVNCCGASRKLKKP